MACHHCNLMQEYYAAREAQEQRAEMYGAGYATETREFYETQEQRVTFKAFLQQSMDRRG
jgi:Trp operon repressor